MDQKIEQSENQTAIQNKDFDSDVEYALKLNRWLLKPLGVWPLNSSSKKLDRRISVISPPFCCFLILFVMIPSFLEIFLDQKYLKARLELLGPTSFSVMVILKYFVFITRGERLQKCISTVANDWRNVRAEEEREIMIKNAGIGRILTGICFAFMFSGALIYTMLVPVLTAKLLISNSNLSIRLLPFPSNFILFDPYVRPIFDIVYVVHCFSTVIMCSITTGACSLAANFVMHACGQCEIVILLLQNLIDGDEQYTSVGKSKLALIILRHLRMIRFVTTVEDLLNEICLVELLGSTMNICLLGYYLITSWGNETTVKLISLFFIWISTTFNIFIFCYISQILTDHCHKIGEESYMIDWYRLPSTQGRSLILLIGMANRPVRLTAGKMVELSFLCFCNVMKAAMAYLNILRTVTA